jgi:hypothetical protein
MEILAREQELDETKESIDHNQSIHGGALMTAG